MCGWIRAVGPKSVLWLGIETTEIEAACRLLRVPVAERQDVLWGVRVMAAAATPVLNED